MHINAKRMRRRIYKEQTACSDPGTIIDAAAAPGYLRITDYKERAAAMGFRITTGQDADTGRKVYIWEGDQTDSYDDGAQTFYSLRELSAEIATLWDIATEPEIHCYFDSAGRYHERLTYPDSPIY